MAKTHWLFGSGPDKLLKFAKEIEEESDCSRCVHKEVCSFNMEKLCENYEFGTSANRGCHSCNHRFTRFDEKKVPCFSCPHFEEKKK